MTNDNTLPCCHQLPPITLCGVVSPLLSSFSFPFTFFPSPPAPRTPHTAADPAAAPATNEEVKKEEKEQALSFTSSFTSSFSSSCPERAGHAGRTLLLLAAREDRQKMLRCKK